MVKLLDGLCAQTHPPTATIPESSADVLVPGPKQPPSSQSSLLTPLIAGLIAGSVILIVVV